MAVVPQYPAQRILVATDFSDGAEAALEVAAQYARGLQARLHLLHVFAMEEIGATQLLAEAAAKVGPDVPVTVAGTGGDPAKEILRYARRHPIDLIVVGAHGHTGATRVLLGSVGRARRPRRPLSRACGAAAPPERVTGVSAGAGPAMVVKGAQAR